VKTGDEVYIWLTICKAIHHVWEHDAPWTQRCGHDVSDAIFNVALQRLPGPAKLVYDPDDSGKFEKASRATTALSHCDQEDAECLRQAVLRVMRLNIDYGRDELRRLRDVFSEWAEAPAVERLAALADDATS